MIINTLKLLSPFLFLSLFMGCASMKPHYKMCKETDWREMGIKDGKQDKPLELQYHTYQKMCADFDDKDLKPDLTMYRFGHSVGVKELCTFTKGRDYGLAQKVSSNNCSKTKHKVFYKGIAAGINDYCTYDSGRKLALKGFITSKVCTKARHPKFFKGVSSGVKTYCTYQYGLKVGSENGKYTGICSGDSEDKFIKGHTIGKNQFHIKKLESELTSLKIENARLQERLKSLEEDNSDLRYKNSSLTSKIEDLEDTVSELQTK